MCHSMFSRCSNPFIGLYCTITIYIHLFIEYNSLLFLHRNFLIINPTPTNNITPNPMNESHAYGIQNPDPFIYHFLHLIHWPL